MRKQTARRVVFMLLLSGAAAEARAQTVLGGAAWASGWDDETARGKGMLIGAGVAQALGRHLVVEGEVAWARHNRDSVYLAAEGTPLLATARLAYMFLRPGVARVRERRRGSITQPAFELGGGVSIKSGDRVSIRPELRSTSTRGQAVSSTLEPPLWIIRAGVTLEWRVRRGR